MVPAGLAEVSQVPARQPAAMEVAQTVVSLVGNYRGAAAWGKLRPLAPAGRRSIAGEPSEGA